MRRFSIVFAVLGALATGAIAFVPEAAARIDTN